MNKQQQLIEAEKLNLKLHQLLDHDQFRVRILGQHLIIDIEESSSGVWATIARLTYISDNMYQPAYRNHKGRWEPLPVTGELSETTESLVEMLDIYLQPY